MRSHLTAQRLRMQRVRSHLTAQRLRMQQVRSHLTAQRLRMQRVRSHLAAQRLRMQRVRSHLAAQRLRMQRVRSCPPMSRLMMQWRSIHPPALHLLTTAPRSMTTALVMRTPAFRRQPGTWNGMSRASSCPTASRALGERTRRGLPSDKAAQHSSVRQRWCSGSIEGRSHAPCL